MSKVPFNLPTINDMRHHIFQFRNREIKFRSTYSESRWENRRVRSMLAIRDTDGVWKLHQARNEPCVSMRTYKGDDLSDILIIFSKNNLLSLCHPRFGNNSFSLISYEIIEIHRHQLLIEDVSFDRNMLHLWLLRSPRGHLLYASRSTGTSDAGPHAANDQTLLYMQHPFSESPPPPQTRSVLFKTI